MLYRQERICSKRDLFIIIIIFFLLLFLLFIIFVLFIFILIFLLLLLLLALLSLGNYFFACINLPFGPICSNILGGEKQEESLKDLISQELSATCETRATQLSAPCPHPQGQDWELQIQLQSEPKPEKGESSNTEMILVHCLQLLRNLCSQGSGNRLEKLLPWMVN